MVWQKTFLASFIAALVSAGLITPAVAEPSWEAVNNQGLPPDQLAEAAEPRVSEFWIYFKLGKFDISPDAAHILDTALATIKLRGGAKEVVLTGHADTVGSEAYDLRLSHKRARTAKQYLIQRGVPASIITDRGKGKTDLRVPTPDNVRERENRNVHVEIR